MNAKRMFMFCLIGFVLMLESLGFAAAAQRSEPFLQATSPSEETTLVPPGATPLAGIPLTGETEPVWTEIVVFYGLIGVTALFLILALLNLANKSTAPRVEHTTAPPDQTRKN